MIEVYESTLINECLDEALPELPMRPAAPPRRYVLRLCAKLVDVLPNFETAIRKWVPEPAVAFPRGTGEAVWPDVEPPATAAGRR
jgi:hypothetical protein